jgi:hypothetical protein
LQRIKECKKNIKIIKKRKGNLIGQLISFDRMKRQLALTTEIDEIKQLRDKAEALRLYVKKAG